LSMRGSTALPPSPIRTSARSSTTSDLQAAARGSYQPTFKAACVGRGCLYGHQIGLRRSSNVVQQLLVRCDIGGWACQLASCGLLKGYTGGLLDGIHQLKVDIIVR
jgi:hypothetical protein